MDTIPFDGGAEGSHGGTVITKLEASSIDRVVAGQAVTDLASAVKELVDNALDANSKTIKSKFIAFARTFHVATMMKG
jgi:hypothetical protein